MTDLPPPADDSGNMNEILSAYLDGEATPDEVALVEADPALVARVEAMRSVSMALTPAMTPAPATIAMRERHLGAALDLFDEQQASRSAEAVTVAPPSSHADGGSASVSSLEAARERKRPRRLSLVTGVAAALALVFAGIVAFGFGTSTGDEVVSADVATTDSAVAIESTAQDASAPLEAFANDADADDAAGDDAASDEDTSIDDAADAASASDDAMEEAEEAAMDDEEAMDDEADEPSAAAGASVLADGDARFGYVLLRQPDAEERFADGDFDPLAAFTAQPLFVGQFDDPNLAVETFASSVHASVTVGEIEQAQREAFAALDCSDQLRDVTDLDGSTLIATATIAGDAVEFHRTTRAQVLVVDHQSCSIDSEFTAP